MTNEIAPIVLFVYNRPWHTEQTLEALSANALADQSVLYIVCDGPKNEEDANQVDETRKIIRRRKWCEEVNIIELPVNKGLADSIVFGVTKIVNEWGKVIVLEDDIVPSRGFLTYMNDALRIYENNESVMHISGYMYPVTKRVENGTVFLRILSCWGWATWKRAWKNYSNDVDGYLRKLNTAKARRRFDIKGNATFYGQLLKNANGTMKTWAVRWYASWYFMGGYSLFPKTTLINNIGHDGTGMHSGSSAFYTPNVLAQWIDVSAQPLIESEEYLTMIDAFYKQINISRKNFERRSTRIWRKFKSLVYKIIVGK